MLGEDREPRELSRVHDRSPCQADAATYGAKGCSILDGIPLAASSAIHKQSMVRRLGRLPSGLQPCGKRAAAATGWLTWNRRLAAGFGMCGLAVVGIMGYTPLTPKVANVALVALSVASLIGWIEARHLRGTPSARLRASPLNVESVASSRLARPSLVTAALFGLAAVLICQTWFQVGTSIASGDIQPPDGTAWIGRMFSPWWPVPPRTSTSVGGSSRCPIDIRRFRRACATSLVHGSLCGRRSGRACLIESPR
jgi:hypothetical protein